MTDRYEKNLKALSHEIWAAAQLAPGEGIVDGVARVEAILRAQAEYEYEVWQGDALQAGGRETDYASAQSEANHYAMMYAPDGPVEVRIYEKRLLSTTQQPADDEVVFYDGVGAGRSSVKSCRDGVQWVRVGDRVYWPLSDSDARRLQSACCGNGSFDGPATPNQEEEK